MEQDAESWFERGYQQFIAGDFEGAIASYDQAIHFKLDNHDAWYNRGYALGSLGRFEEAIAVALKNAQSWLRTVTYAALIPWLQDLLPFVPPHSGAREFLNNQIRLAQAESGKMGLPFDDPYYWAAFTLAGQIT